MNERISYSSGNAYRKAAPAPPEEPKPMATFRIVREPYSYQEYVYRFRLEEYRTFLFFWKRWTMIDWAFSVEIAIKKHKELTTAREVKVSGKRVMWSDTEGLLT
jgi:hypothetical protein